MRDQLSGIYNKSLYIRIRADRWYSVNLWHCSHHLGSAASPWLLQGCILLPSLLGTIIFLIYFHLGEYSTYFQISFIVSSVQYAVLRTGWLQVLSSSMNNRLLIMGSIIACFTVVMISLGIMVAGLELENLQALLLEVGVSTFHNRQAWLN